MDTISAGALLGRVAWLSQSLDQIQVVVCDALAGRADTSRVDWSSLQEITGGLADGEDILGLVEALTGVLQTGLSIVETTLARPGADHLALEAALDAVELWTSALLRGRGTGGLIGAGLMPAPPL